MKGLEFVVPSTNISGQKVAHSIQKRLDRGQCFVSGSSERMKKKVRFYYLSY